MIYCKTRFFACPLFREPDKFAKITGYENLNTVTFQCSRNKNAKITGSKVIKLTQTPKLRVAKIKGFTVTNIHSSPVKRTIAQTSCCQSRFCFQHWRHFTRKCLSVYEVTPLRSDVVCSNVFGLTTTGVLTMWRKMCCCSARMHRRTMLKDHWLVLAVVCLMQLKLLLLLSDTAVVMLTVLFLDCLPRLFRVPTDHEKS